MKECLNGLRWCHQSQTVHNVLAGVSHTIVREDGWMDSWGVWENRILIGCWPNRANLLVMFLRNLRRSCVTSIYWRTCGRRVPFDLAYARPQSGEMPKTFGADISRLVRCPRASCTRPGICDSGVHQLLRRSQMDGGQPQGSGGWLPNDRLSNEAEEMHNILARFHSAGLFTVGLTLRSLTKW